MGDPLASCLQTPRIPRNLPFSPLLKPLHRESSSRCPLLRTQLTLPLCSLCQTPTQDTLTLPLLHPNLGSLPPPPSLHAPPLILLKAEWAWLPTMPGTSPGHPSHPAPQPHGATCPQGTPPLQAPHSPAATCPQGTTPLSPSPPCSHLHLCPMSLPLSNRQLDPFQIRVRGFCGWNPARAPRVAQNRSHRPPSTYRALCGLSTPGRILSSTLA